MAHHHHHPENSTRNISLAFFLNLVFAVIELIGGLLTNSIAILSDALHDFGDSISLGIAWFLQKKSNKKRDRYYSYGYKRFSMLGAIILSVVLLVSSFFILRESVIRIFNPQMPDAQGMLLLSLLGIAVNGFAAYRLRTGHTLNEKAVLIHLMEDILGWVAVFIASIIMLFIELPILDPLLSIGITIWVLINVYRNLKQTFGILMQEVPQNIDVEMMLYEIKKMPHVVGMHDFHLWSLDGERNIMTLHIVTDEKMPAPGLISLKQSIRRLADKYKISHVTLEFENEKESDDCRFVDDC